MEKYYMIYDMTPSDEYHQDYLRIGFAPKNPDDTVGKGVADRIQ